MPNLPVSRSSIRREAQHHSRAIFDALYELMLQEVTTLEQLLDWRPAGLTIEQRGGVCHLVRKE